MTYGGLASDVIIEYWVVLTNEYSELALHLQLNPFIITLYIY